MIPDKSVEEIDAKIVANRLRYGSEPELKAMADMIHYNRMSGTGEVCDQCLCLAISIVDEKKEKEFLDPTNQYTGEVSVIQIMENISNGMKTFPMNEGDI